MSDDGNEAIKYDSIYLMVNGKQQKFYFRSGSDADRGVINQIFVNEDYAIRRLKRSNDINIRYDDICKRGKIPLILDLGANIGASALYFHCHYPKSKIIAVEPDAENFSLLKENVKNTPVDCINNAVSNFRGKGYLADNGYGEWGYALAPVDNGSGQYVDVLRIDDILSVFHESQFELFIVKMDIEGGEREVFDDACLWFERCDLLIIEIHDWLYPNMNTSRNFFRHHSALYRDLVHIGENIFSVKNVAG